jgi:hypothetical protein
MTAHDARETISTAPLPRPRPAGDDTVSPAALSGTTAEVEQEPTAASPHRAGLFPWPEPWGSSRVAGPRTEFWDVTTASWRSRGPVPPRPTAD